MGKAYIEPRTSGGNDLSILSKDIVAGMMETTDGDFILGEDHDTQLANTKEILVQRLLWFVKTPFGTSSFYPSFGSHLHLLYGKNSNDLDLIEESTDLLINDLTTNFFSPVPDKVLILPLSGASFIFDISIFDNISNNLTTDAILRQTYEMQTDTQTIEFLGANTY